MSARSVLRCSALRKTFGERVAVDDVGFEIAPGETYGLLGPNGAGKTTTISMLCGLLDRDAGEVEVAGEPISPRAVEAKSAIGLVPQDIALYPDLSARENLRFFGRLQRLSGDELRQRVDEVLDVVALADRADDKVADYSGGMQRRANIAVGLLHRPKLLILDEPTVGVDPQSRNQILEAVDRLGTEGMSVLYTTHYMEEAERLCDRIGIIDGGRLVAEGTRAELVHLVGAHDRVRVDLTGDLDAFESAIRNEGISDEVERVADNGGRDGTVQMAVADAATAIARVLSVAGRLGVDVASVNVAQPDLESVFLHLTGKALRD
ncbi:MAG: ABC transporter ATP-binding protein [Microthrixaceae bacterium]